MFTQSVADCVAFVNRRLCIRLSCFLSTFVFIVLSYRRLSLSFDPLLASRQGSTCVYLFTFVTCTYCFNVTISHTFRGLKVFCIKSTEQYFSYRVRFRVMVFNTTFNSISAIGLELGLVCLTHFQQYFSYKVRFRVIVFNTTFNSISAIWLELGYGV